MYIYTLLSLAVESFLPAELRHQHFLLLQKKKPQHCRVRHCNIIGNVKGNIKASPGHIADTHFDRCF